MAVKTCPVCKNETDQWGYCQHHCHYCFKPLEVNEECDCGYEYKKHITGALPVESTLENGRYVIGAALGKGGFGITYLGYDTKLDAKVAIKEYFPDEFVARGRKDNLNYVYAKQITDKYNEYLERFQREAKILKKLEKTPNIVKVENYIENENNTSYIVMEYIEGKTLKELIKENNGKMNWEELRTLLDPLLSSLQQIHEKGIIHRDIAPDNIIITPEGEPVLLDFGIARIGENYGGSVAVGKVGYAPIEQMRYGNSQDRRTDVYALGATYYYALTGKNLKNAKARYGKDDQEPVNQLNPEVPAYVNDAIMKAISPEIDNRWENVADFQDALNTPVEPEPEPEGASNKMLIVLLGLLILAAVITGIILLFR